MSLWQAIVVVCEEFNDLKLLRPSAPSQPLEAFYGYLAAAGYELDKLGSLGVIEFLQNLKDPLHHGCLSCIILVYSVLSKVHD